MPVAKCLLLKQQHELERCLKHQRRGLEAQKYVPTAGLKRVGQRVSFGPAVGIYFWPGLQFTPLMLQTTLQFMLLFQ